MPNALPRRSVLLGAAALAGCTAPGAPAGPGSAAADPIGPPMPFDRAVQVAAERVLTSTPAAGPRQTVVIDPLVNGVTGDQSAATQAIQAHILQIGRANFPQFDFQPFNSATVARNPLVMVGTFTPINFATPANAARDAYRFCLVMGDLRSGKAVAKAVTRAEPDRVDTTPTTFFRDSPAWTDDAAVKAYVTTCQSTKVGDPIAPTYVNAILTASIVSEAIEAYTAGRYREALDLYRNAAQTQAGDQLRVHNGIYLANWKLNRRPETSQAFADVVDFSLANKRLAVKLLFRPGSTGLEGQGSWPTEMWLEQIANRVARSNACLQVTGHTSHSGSPELNERLSLLRAEYVKSRLEGETAALHGRLIAAGAGFRDNLVGTGRDDITDALDRRVEFTVLNNCA